MHKQQRPCAITMWQLLVWNIAKGAMDSSQTPASITLPSTFLQNFTFIISTIYLDQTSMLIIPRWLWQSWEEEQSSEAIPPTFFPQKAKVPFQFYLRTHIALTFNWNSCSGKSKKSSCVQLPLSISSCCNFPSICLSNTSDSSFKPFLTFDIPSYKLQQRNPSNFVLRSNQLNWKTHLIHPWPRNLLECVLFVSL